MNLFSKSSFAAVGLALWAGLAAAQAGANATPGATDLTRIGSEVNINTLNSQTATGAAQLKAGFNCPPGKTWNANVAFPACVGTATVAGPRACNAGPVVWYGPTGAQCVADAPVRDHGQSLAVTASGAFTGSATALCTNGSWGTTGATSCTPPQCAATTLSWTVGSSYCQAATGASANGAVVTLASANSNSGSASFACVNGAWGAPAGATCTGSYTPPAPTRPAGSGLAPMPITPTPTPGGCTYAATSGSWESCSGSIAGGTVAVGGSVSINNTTPGFTGAINFRCEVPAGGGAPSMRETSRTCTPGAALKCSYSAFGTSVGATHAWSESGVQCAGPLPAEPSAGSSITVTSTNGNSGSYTLACLSNGQWNSTPSYSCTMAPPTKCPQANAVWDSTDGTLTCVSTLPETSFGQTVKVTVTNNNTGEAKYTCNNGTWSAAFDPSCSKPVLKCPGGGTMSWGQGASWGECYGAGPANTMTEGSAFTASNMAYGYAGTGHYTCREGIWRLDAAGCQPDTTPATPGCTTSGYVNGLTWNYCTKKPAYASTFQDCTSRNNCVPSGVAPPALSGNEAPGRAYPDIMAQWRACQSDPRPWEPLSPALQADFAAENLATRQAYCTD